jgi:hypothetical protein
VNAYGQLEPYGSYGIFGIRQTSAREHCSAAQAAKRQGKGTYKWRNINVQIGKWCKGAEAEEASMKAEKFAAGMSPRAQKEIERQERRAAKQTQTVLLVFGGLTAIGLLMAGGIVMAKQKKKK